MATKSALTFVVGVPRSGTTLLRVLLDSHSKIASGPEAGWITGEYTDSSIMRLTELLGDGELGLVQNYPGTSQKQVLRLTANLIQGLFKPYLAKRGKERLVLKTPDDIAHVDFLRKLMPNANFIHILRDGRDVALSTVSKKGTFFSDSTLGYEFGDLTFANALKRWMVWEQRAHKTLRRIPKRVHSLRYEDLVTNPETELRSLCNFLGEEFETEMLQYAQHAHEYPTWEAGSSDVKNKDVIVSASVARWKRELNAFDAASISKELNDYLIATDYEDTFANFDRDFLEIARTQQQHTAANQLDQGRVNRLTDSEPEILSSINSLSSRQEELDTAFKTSHATLTKELAELAQTSQQERVDALREQQQQSRRNAELEALATERQNLLDRLTGDFTEALELTAKLREELRTKQLDAEQKAKLAKETEEALLDARKAKDRAMRHIAEDRKRRDLLTENVAALKRENEELENHRVYLNEENERLKRRVSQVASSTQSLQQIISQQERETWEKEQVIQGMLQSPTWKTGRFALGPMALARSVIRGKTPKTVDAPAAQPLTSMELRKQAQLDAQEAEEAFKAAEAESANLAHEAQEAFQASETHSAEEAASSVSEPQAPTDQQAFIEQQAPSRVQAGNKSSTTSISGVTADPKINLGTQVEEYFGAHRSGWAYAVQNLADMHEPKAIHLDTFMERTFCWEGGRNAILEPWLGIIHVPPGGPDWFLGNQSNQNLFASDYWKASEPFCAGLYCLSNHHRRELRKHVNVPIETLIHPTETPDVLWDPKRFVANRRPKVVQLGWWLRVLHAIYELPETSFEKVFLRPRSDQAFLDALASEREIHIGSGQLTPAMEHSVTEHAFLANDQYDKLLSESVVFMQLYDASANNAVIECIVRNTPLLINPLDPVVEYLGAGYPLYFSSLEEAAEKLENRALILHTHDYLKNHPIKQKLTGEYFRRSLQQSQLLRRATL